MNAWPNLLLKEIANKIVVDRRASIPELERIIAATSTKLEAARAAIQRAEAFPVNGVALCPKCWVSGKEVELVQINGTGKNTDLYRCPTCRFQFPHLF